MKRSSTLQAVPSETVLALKSPGGHSPQITIYVVHRQVLQEGAKAKYAYRQQASFSMAPCNPSKHHVPERTISKRNLKPQEKVPSAWPCPVKALSVRAPATLVSKQSVYSSAKPVSARAGSYLRQEE